MTNGTCVKKIPVGLPCRPDDVCDDNAQCSSPLGGLCQCQPEYYQVVEMMVVMAMMLAAMVMIMMVVVWWWWWWWW